MILNSFVFLCVFIFLIGFLGVILKKNFIVALLSGQLMFISIVMIASFVGQVKGLENSGYLSFFLLAIGLIEGLVMASIAVVIYCTKGEVRLRFFEKFKG